MSKINNDSLRTPFFPNKSPNQRVHKRDHIKGIERNDSDRKTEIDNMSKNHTKVSIDSKIKDFSRIKKVVDQAPEVNREAFLASLKERISNGEYNIDPEKIAEKMITNEF